MTDPTSDPAPSTPPGDPDGLGDAGKKAIDTERTARKAAEQQLKALQEQLAASTERVTILEAANQTLSTDVQARDLQVTRLNVGLAKGLPQPLIDRLRGDDEAALSADADALLALIPTQSGPVAPTVPGARPDPSQGARIPANADPAAEFAALFTRARNT